MKLAEKIQYLRKKHNYSQDDLAEKCNVSRQAISKWEYNISTPELEKIILLSNLFNVSVDTLIKDDLNIDSTIQSHTCHKNFNNSSSGYYEGILIKESISDEKILDLLCINKVELWQTNDTPKYWTALYFTSQDVDLPVKFSKVMLDGSWYVDFKHNNTKYIVFKDTILNYEISNNEEKEKIANECKKRGIPNLDGIDE